MNENDAAFYALRALTEEQREWVFDLPPAEAARVVEALVAFPGSVFLEDGTVALDLFGDEEDR